METQGDDDQGFGSLTPKRKKTDEEENQRKNSKLESPANPSSSLKRNADNPEEKSSQTRKKTKNMADPASEGEERDFKEALRQSRLADMANSDHQAIRDLVAQGARQGGADDKEVKRIVTARNWAKREDFLSIRKILSIGFNVYHPDRGGIAWRFSVPSAETKGELMMDLLHVDGVHYDLIIFGDLSDEKLQGFVLFCCYFNPQVLFFRLTREQQDKMVRGFVDGRAFVIVGYSGNC